MRIIIQYNKIYYIHPKKPLLEFFPGVEILLIFLLSCPHTTYGGDFLSKKPSATSIGFGKKSDFTRCLTVSPSAGKYKLKSFWD